MKRAIEQLEQSLKAYKSLAVDRVEDVKFFPEYEEYLWNFIFDCTAFLDYSEALSKLKNTDIEEEKRWVVEKIDDILLNSNSRAYSKTQEELNFVVLKSFKEKVSEGKYQDVWDRYEQILEDRR